jgi:iron complex outermembrane receptor protein
VRKVAATRGKDSEHAQKTTSERFHGRAAILLTVASTALVSSPAYAQQSGAMTAPPAPATQDNRGGPRAAGTPRVSAPVVTRAATLENVVVTAQRRSVKIKRVPIAITAVSGATLTNQGIHDTQSLAATVPGLNITTNAGNTLVFIRGVGTTALAVENDVGVYVDGINITSSTASLLNLSNIDHVEVLKGPQGTLFGRNAVGGAIQIVTRDPSSTPAADISIGAANYRTFQGNFYGTTGVTQNLSTDLAAYFNNQGDGWGRNLTTGKPTFEAVSVNIRNKWVYRPTDDTKITLSADYAHDTNELGTEWHFLPGAIGVDGKSSYPGFYNSLGNGLSQNQSQQYGGAIRIDQDFGWARGVSLTGYRHSTNRNYIDEDATPLPVVEGGPTPQDDTSVSQEFQLLSPSNLKWIHWILGAYYLDDQYYTPGFTIQAGPTHEVLIVNEPTTSLATYAQATVEVLANTHLTGGIRYTNDYKTVSGVTLIDGQQLPGVIPGVTSPSQQDARFTKVTYRGVLDHQFTSDILAYISYDTGFKSGQFNLISYAAPGVQPESLKAVQGGVKTELFDHRLRLNLSGFHYDYTNIQITQLVVGGTQLLNAAAAEIYGGDLDFNAVITDNFKLRGALSLLHGRYTNFPNAPSYVPTGVGGNRLVSIANARGNTTVESPPETATIGGDYLVPFHDGQIELNANVSYNAGYYWDPDNRLRQPAYALLGAFVKWTPQNDRYDVRLWGNNITGTHYNSLESAFALGDIASPGAPATYGATLSVHF